MTEQSGGGLNTVFRLLVSSIGGHSFHETAFLYREMAEIEAARLSIDHEQYRVKEVSGEIIDGDRVIVDRVVYNLDVRTADSDNRPLAKRIAKSLFVNGDGDIVRLLQVTDSQYRRLIARGASDFTGALCERSVEDYIYMQIMGQGRAE